MKTKVIHSVLLAAIIGALSGGSMAADYKQNPFTLAYEGAITENVKGKVNIRTVTYQLNGIDISANVYTPASYDASKKYPTVVVAHPNGGVKEQVPVCMPSAWPSKATSPSQRTRRIKARAAASRAMWTNPPIALKTFTAWRTSFAAIAGVDVARLGCLASVAAADILWPQRKPTSASSQSQR